MKLVLFLSIACPLVSAGAAAAPQSIYVDVTSSAASTATATPSPGYGAAAGIPGSWNTLDVDTQGAFIPLLSSSGRPTNVICNVISTSVLGGGLEEGFSSPVTGASGDDAALMEDGYSMSFQGWLTLTLVGLESGTYDLYLYSLQGATGSATQVTQVFQSPDATVLGAPVAGDFSAGFAAGATHLLASDIGPSFPDNTGPGVTLVIILSPADPTQLPAVINGFQLVKRGGSVISSSFCSALPNSTGGEGAAFVVGSSNPADNNSRLLATGLPPQQFGIFVTSMAVGPPVHVQGGNLCLAGGIGRFLLPGQVFQASASGLVELEIDLGQIPTPNALVAVNPGETWHFQAWHRDVVQGSLTSNFTGGASVQFQ